MFLWFLHMCISEAWPPGSCSDLDWQIVTISNQRNSSRLIKFDQCWVPSSCFILFRCLIFLRIPNVTCDWLEGPYSGAAGGSCLAAAAKGITNLVMLSIWIWNHLVVRISNSEPTDLNLNHSPNRYFLEMNPSGAHSTSYQLFGRHEGWNQLIPSLEQLLRLQPPWTRPVATGWWMAYHHLSRRDRRDPPPKMEHLPWGLR